MNKKTTTKKQAKSKSSSKPAVKYDDWMMERLKKNKKEAFEYLKTSLSMKDIAKEAGISVPLFC